MTHLIAEIIDYADPGKLKTVCISIESELSEPAIDALRQVIADLDSVVAGCRHVREVKK